MESNEAMNHGILRGFPSHFSDKPMVVSVAGFVKNWCIRPRCIACVAGQM
jgi:hypothetical protein